MIWGPQKRQTWAWSKYLGSHYFSIFKKYFAVKWKRKHFSRNAFQVCYKSWKCHPDVELRFLVDLNKCEMFPWYQYFMSCRAALEVDHPSGSTHSQDRIRQLDLPTYELKWAVYIVLVSITKDEYTTWYFSLAFLCTHHVPFLFISGTYENLPDKSSETIHPSLANLANHGQR